MIVNLNGTVNYDGKIVFDLVPLYFDVNQSVRVTEIFINFNHKMKNLHGYVSSSLIDKSPVNQKQQLVFLQQSNSFRQLFYSPTHLAKYKIQCQSLQAATFDLHLFEDGEKVNFRDFSAKVYLQLEIVTNARVFNQLKATQ